MDDMDDLIRQRIAWLRGCSDLMRAVPLFSLWCHALLIACEAEAEAHERALAGRAEMTTAKIVDLDEWRRLRAAPRLRRSARRLRPGQFSS